MLWPMSGWQSRPTLRRSAAVLVVALAACSSPVSGTVPADSNLPDDPDTSTTGPAEADPSTTGPAGTVAESLAGVGIHALSGLGDPLYPELGNAGYDVQHTNVSLRLDTSSGRLEGVTEMAAVAIVDLDSWSVDMDTVFASEVLVDGQPASWDHQDGELRIDPAAVVGEGATFVMTITYGGLTEPFDSPAATFDMGLQRSEDGFFVLSEPDGTSSWLPVNDHPSDKATYSLRISVPGPLVVAASGSLVEVVQEADGFLTYSFEVRQPVAPYLLALGVGNLELSSEAGPAGIEIRNYFDRDVRDSSLSAFTQQARMIEFLTERFGPYPFDSYGALVLETAELGVALETQTLSTFGSQILGLGEDVVVHELAHQWFGDSVSVESWNEIWMNEGFATYAQWLWVEETLGVPTRDVRIAQAYELISGRAFLNGTDSEPVAAAQAYRQFPPAGDPAPDDLFNATVYLRGALTLHALRLEIGDEAFFDAAKAFQEKFKYGNASTQDFVEVVGEIAGRDLSGFFDAWLHDEAMPPIPELGLEPLES